jgi:hypothetical protein
MGDMVIKLHAFYISAVIEDEISTLFTVRLTTGESDTGRRLAGAQSRSECGGGVKYPSSC